MTHHALTASRTWLSLWWIVMVWPPSPPPTPDLYPYDLDRRSWRELSTWEPIGVVVQTASAIARTIYLV